MRFLWSVLFSQILAVVIAQRSPISLDIISGAPASGQSKVHLTSSATGFDAPKALPINGSSFDWYYFDIISEDSRSSIFLAFFLAPISSLWDNLPVFPTAVWTDAFISLPDGSALNLDAGGNDLIVMTTVNGSSGTLNGTGWGWAGVPDMSFYEVIIDSPETGVQGTLTFKSTAPAHFPCAPITASGEQSFMLGSAPFGWANAVPDANANVDIVINGTEVKFSGAGYHDKASILAGNWGPTAVDTVAKSWLWGHARFGSYTIVWYDLISPDGSEHVSSYISRKGKVLAASCSNMTVRPTGANSVFPPVFGSGPPGGFHISAYVEGEGQLELDVNHTTLILGDSNITMYRWSGMVRGGFKDDRHGITLDGPAMYELFAF
ncbi:uncharacterized protein PHACADRAFT_150957 [Phanerochaete carnosa HHB-10118-sp]|uniref:AttH domain-containing protein n=1 Tax=Phanerochaete carnosa (strain HHB-10118-sp) TaxID=650164 RepID=K5VYX4_PHACS|nr:uncharacterized protein PHACADRAFT_150957 [Phanerochaete carnosa HHB-10118-sp]EKM52035.1 hypothetical protein PHACADRAFT_150957 [Phanerochaete carnosa HHB-10118-sp]